MWKVFFGAVVGGLVAAFTALSAQHWEFHLLPTGMSYAELAATLLAASALILAVLAFGIAVLAVLGWSQFRGLVRKTATETVKAHIDSDQFEVAAVGFLERLFQSGTLRTLIEQRVDHVIYAGRFESTSVSDVEEEREE